MRRFEEHSLFTPPNESARLWRYTSLQRFISLVTRRALFFCRLDQLPDPHEGLFSRATLNRFPSLSQNQEYARTGIAVNCWCRASQESAIHWEAFCPGGSGIAIVSSFKRLKRALRSDPALRHASIFITQVRYVDYSKHRHVPSKGYPINVLAPAVTKRAEFQGEKEVRLVLWCGGLRGRDGTALLSSGGRYVPFAPEIFIEELVCGPRTPAWALRDLELLLKDLKLQAIPVRRSEVDELRC
jgi:hypothetical protein